ncbi:MAG: integrase core domain-containing protein [Parabacteroides merdae]
MPRENAIAERVNGILKEEWLNKEMITTLGQARDIVRKVIDIYNTRRPHSSVEMLTPEEARHAKKGPLKENGKLFINVNKLFFYEQDQTDIFATK